MTHLRGWWPERVDLTFPGSVDDTVAILAAGVIPRRELLGLRTTQHRVLAGTVRKNRMAVTCTPPRVRNSWSPVLRGRLVPDGTGCRLTGSVGWHPITRLVTVLLLVVLVPILVATLGVRGTPSSGAPLPAAAVLVVTLVGIVVAGRSADADTEVIHQWLAEAQRVGARS